MKHSVILSAAIKYLIPLLLIFSIFLLFRGHNDPGGGFAGGLTASAAAALYLLANGVNETKKFLRVNPLMLIATGLIIALFSGLPGLISGDEFMKALWLDIKLPVVGKPGTPILFDIGVYLLVAGMVIKILFNLSESEGSWN